MTKEFFRVTHLEQVFTYIQQFARVETEVVPLSETVARILAADIISDVDLPDFRRATMDGFAVQGSSTYGASESNPAYLTVTGTISMGQSPDYAIGPGEAARIATGGMLPQGADSVVMIEHTEAIDDSTIEAYRSVAPGQNIIEIGEDFTKNKRILACGTKIRPQESGLLAAFGKQTVEVYKRPVIGIISTGDEIVDTTAKPGPGQIRDINSFTLSAMVNLSGGIPITFGIVKDDFQSLFKKCSQALDRCDMILVSGGSSVGTRDFTIEVISAFAKAEILVHGISISPGKPTILAKVKNKAFWGLPGHVVSAMVVYSRVVSPFIDHVAGISAPQQKKTGLRARLSRNVPSAQGRVDYIRVRLSQKEGNRWAEPILGKSGLLNTMIKADGLVEIGLNLEGLDKGAEVEVIPF
jgi:molybdopterin molybdotransferase